MQQIRLQTLRFDEQVIQFKNGANYIVGYNSSGKTTIFTLIQYILGIRVNLGFFGSFFKKNIVSMDLRIGVVDYSFTRNLVNREIVISRGNEEFKFTVGNRIFYGFLLDLLQIPSELEDDPRLSITLLKNSFQSDENGADVSGKRYREAKLLALGVNTLFPKRITAYLDELKIQIRTQSQIVSNIDSYREDVAAVFDRDLPEHTGMIKEVLDSGMKKHHLKLNELQKIYSESNEVLKNIRDKNERNLVDVLSQLESVFSNFKNTLGLESRISLYDFLEGDFLTSSFGEIGLLKFIFDMIVQAYGNLTGGNGLLLNDVSFLHLDQFKISQVRKFVEQFVMESNFQYIEFTSNMANLNKKDIVFDTSKFKRNV